jgi:hypothetical protein
MTDHRTMHEEDLQYVEADSGSDRSTQILEVREIPVLVSLPELATMASQRATEKKSLRSQTRRLRAISWRRTSAGNMLVVGVLLMLTMTTYWGLSGGKASLSLPDAEQTTVQQAGNEQADSLDPAAVTFVQDFSGEEGSEIAQPPAVPAVAIPARVIARQVIVQPLDPVLTARRQATSREKLTEEELRRSSPVPR